jgi:hypothetical protein
VSPELDPVLVALGQATAALEAGDAFAARDATALAARLCLQSRSVPAGRLAMLRGLWQRCTHLAQGHGQRLAAALVEAGVSRRANRAYREAR